MHRKLIIILSFVSFELLAGFGGRGLSFANRTPKYGIVGVSFGAIRPNGGDGHIFTEGNDDPHGEFGVYTGFDFWKRYYSTYDFHIGLEGKYQQYHFHYGEEELDGYFRFLNISIPVTIHFPIRNYPYLFIKGGFALTSLNVLPETTGKVGSNTYKSKLSTSWPVYPEIILGIDFLEEKGKKAFIRAGLDYTFIPMGSMGEFGASIPSLNEYATGTFNPHKFQIKITIYPIWKRIKVDYGNCPT